MNNKYLLFFFVDNQTLQTVINTRVTTVIDSTIYLHFYISIIQINYYCNSFILASTASLTSSDTSIDCNLKKIVYYNSSILLTKTFSNSRFNKFRYYNTSNTIETKSNYKTILFHYFFHFANTIFFFLD
jgi:hypothetical protein